MAYIAIAATILLCISDIEIWWKVIAGTLCVVSFLLPFDGTLMAFPLIIQLALCVWGLIYWDGPRLRR